MRCFYLFLAMLLIGPVVAQQSYKVKRGERPLIDLQSVPDNAYYKGVIKIKLAESYTAQMDETPVRIEADGIVRFGINELDLLNEQLGIRNFDRPFNFQGFSQQFSDRHRAWGFHLWYKLYFDETMDVKAIVQAYSNISGVTIAEPEYIKVLVTQEDPIPYTPETVSNRNVEWTPDDPRFGEQWHYHNTGQQNGTADADIDLPEGWEIEKGNPEVIVSIEDGGINYTHGDIAANMWSGIGYNFVNNSSNVTSHDHGTHVAGTVAAVSNNGIGVAGVAGGSGSGDGVRLMSCQVFTNGGSGGFENAPIWAADNGAAISQNSWQYTSPGFYDQAVLDAIDYFNINGGGDALVDGGLTIFAAGNNDSQSQYYPAYYSGCFSVAGLTNQDKKAWYSNYGDWVEVAAPGGETDNVAERGVLSTLPNNTYGFYQGTSMACPHVSGLAALIVSLAYGQFTPQQVADIIKNTTDNVDAVNPGFPGMLGTGRINAFAALTEAQNQMINVNNPLAFSALAGSNTEINLNWVKNPENEDVMIAYTMDDLFGDPVQTQIYQVGDIIEGGGILIYKGPESTFTHPDLTSNTPYYYKAWSLNDVSEYSQGLTTSATTLKEPITGFPYHESFDAENFPPANWDNKTSTETGLWDRQTSGTNPDCLPHSGDGMGRYNSNIYETGISGILITPPIVFADEEYETSLWVFRDNQLASIADKLEIYINIVPNTGFATLIGTINRSIELDPVVESAGWYEYIFDIPASYLNKMAYLVYKGISNQGNNIFIDDVKIEIPVNCFPPVDLTIGSIGSTVATAGWTGVAPASTWDVEYGPAGFEPGTGIILAGVGNPTVDLEGLDSNTAYEVYVRGACETDNTSTWAGPVGFTTLCSASAPWDETFEAMNSSFNCWQVFRNTADDGGLNGNNLIPVTEGSWFVCTPESFEGNGTDYILNSERSAAIMGDATGFNWLISGDLLIPESGKTDLSFWLNFTNDESGTTLFHVVAYNGSDWSSLLSYDNPTGFSDPFDPVHINLDQYAGSLIRIAFVFEESNGYALSIDDVNIGEATNYWTGTENNIFTNPANWRLDLPQANDPVHIFKTLNTPVINEDYYLLNVFIHPGASLIFGPQARVEIDGAVFNESDPDGLWLQADINSHAMMIDEGILGDATFDYYAGAVDGKHGWQLLSAPVNDQSIIPEFVSEPAVAGNDLFKWNESEGQWVNSRLEDLTWNPEFETVFGMGKGYLTSFGTGGIRQFKGYPYPGQFEYLLTNSGEPGNGWHLVGNPFPCNYIWFPGYTMLSYTAKIWDDESASYSELYPGSIIPAYTGFWVQNLAQLPAAFAFFSDSRTFEPATLVDPGPMVIKLSVSESAYNTTQSIVIRQDSQSGEGFDQLTDSHFLPGYAPQFYSMAGIEKLSTNTLPTISSGTLIPLGFVKNEAADFSLEIQIPDLYPGMIVNLHDIKTGEIHDLGVNPVYNFTADEGDDPNRFELFFATVGVDDNSLSSDFTCYASGKTIYLKSTIPIHSDIIISSLTGMQLIRTKATGKSLITIDGTRLASGTYLVSVAGESGILTKKVVLY